MTLEIASSPAVGRERAIRFRYGVRVFLDKPAIYTTGFKSGESSLARRAVDNASLLRVRLKRGWLNG